MKNIKFGDVLKNGYASLENPGRNSIVTKVTEKYIYAVDILYFKEVIHFKDNERLENIGNVLDTEKIKTFKEKAE